MNSSEAIVQQETQQDRHMLTAMVGIGVMCALLIVLTYEGTRERISMLREEALNNAIFEVLPGIESTVSYQINAQGALVSPEHPDPTRPQLFAGYDPSGNLVGFAIEAAGQGYADVIRVLYGYDPFSEQIVGFHVLESKETPGLGDKIEKDPSFLANFNGLDVSLDHASGSLSQEVVAVKSGMKEQPWEVDGITGATISSRAIAAIINRSAGEIHPLLHANMDLFSPEPDIP